MPKFEKTKNNQFFQLWTVTWYDYQRLKNFSQNIWKNNLIVDTILKLKAEYNIIFIQKPS